jgi:hypothetical protein
MDANLQFIHYGHKDKNKKIKKTGVKSWARPRSLRYTVNTAYVLNLRLRLRQSCT